MSDFIHLHTHSEYSLLDGLSKISHLVAKAKKYKMDSLALTDHGVMYGTIPFYNECQQQGIKPIIGCEIYMAHRSRFDKQPRVDADQYHLILLAKNNIGYQNLMKIVTKAHLEGFYYKPRVDLELLEKYSKGLIATSACIAGEVPSLLIQGKDEEAEKTAKKLSEIFKDSFYLEIQSHEGLEKQEIANKKIIALSRKLGIPLVAANDIHYVEPDDAKAQDALLAIQTKKTIADKDRLTMLNTPSFYFRSPEEMKSLFAEYPDAIKNTKKIAEQCNLKIPIGQFILPYYPIPGKQTASDHLKDLVYKRMKKRFPNADKEIIERVDYELSVISKKGFSTYFLIFQDFVNWAKRQGIRVGPGRGSAAGSLVSYILRITSINPIDHKLPFERFLNPDRPTPPDIDLDFAEDRRDEVIAYVTNKYGKNKVAQIITFGRMEARGSIRDIGRVLGMPYSEPDKIAKLIPLGHSIEEALNSVFELQELYKEERYKKLIDLAKRVEGCSRHSSTHAAGVVIADKELTDYTPLQKESKGERIITQYDMYSLDLNVSDRAIGLLKMDFLGLRNLTILQKAIDYVKEQKDIVVDMSEIPLDDKKVYEMLSRGETTGVFQLESTGMKRLAKNLQPSRFSDITAMVALYRPGPMDLIPEFIKGKKNIKSVKYPHIDLKPILEESYGIALYQEQCLMIANEMAGYSLGEADILRRAIGKKKKSIMVKEKKKFVAGAQKKGYTKKKAEEVWYYIERFAGYGFNKAHSASYAMIAYQTAYMKVNYPIEFMAALLTGEASNKDKIAVEIEECRRMGIYVNPPNINLSEIGFTIHDDPHSFRGKSIRFGFSAIKNVGEAAIGEILKERKKSGQFKTFTDFLKKVDTQKLNKRVLESLIQVGAFDQFGKRSAMLAGLEKLRTQIEAEKEQKANGQFSLFEDPQNQNNKSEEEIKDNWEDVEELPQKEALNYEKDLLGFYLTEHPLSGLLKKAANQVSHRIEEISMDHSGQKIKIGGIITSVRQVFTRRGNKEMAFMSLKDGAHRLDLVLFPQIYEQYKKLIVVDKVVIIVGKVDYREDKISILTEKVSEPKETDDEDYSQGVDDNCTICIPTNTPKEKLQELKQMLVENKGQDEVKIIFGSKQNPLKEITLPFTINYNSELKEKIRLLLT